MIEFLQNLDLQTLLANYGYYAILFLTFLEGETIVIIAGIAASQGLLDPVVIAVCAFTGSFFSDQIMFSLGKYKGQSVLKRFPRLNKNMDRAAILIKKYDVYLILGFRFVYGVRNVTPIMLGVSGVSHAKFLALNAIGAAIWAASFTAGGFYAGRAFSHVMEQFGAFVFYIIGAILLVGGVIGYVRYRKNKKTATELAAIGREAQTREKHEQQAETMDQPEKTTNDAP
jgi:Uncharacterized membrane-associated protein